MLLRTLPLHARSPGSVAEDWGGGLPSPSIMTHMHAADTGSTSLITFSQWSPINMEKMQLLQMQSHIKENHHTNCLRQKGNETKQVATKNILYNAASTVRATLFEPPGKKTKRKWRGYYERQQQRHHKLYNSSLLQ